MYNNCCKLKLDFSCRLILFKCPVLNIFTCKLSYNKKHFPVLIEMLFVYTRTVLNVIVIPVLPFNFNSVSVFILEYYYID